MTRLDAFILTSTILVFFSLIEVLVTTILDNNQQTERAKKIDRYCRVIFPRDLRCHVDCLLRAGPRLVQDKGSASPILSVTRKESRIEVQPKTTVKRTLRVSYPGAEGGLVLRTELDWGRDIEPIAVSEDGNTATVGTRGQTTIPVFQAMPRARYSSSTGRWEQTTSCSWPKRTLKSFIHFSSVIIAADFRR